MLRKNSNSNNYKKLQCLNCGHYGHAIKTCNYPITSYGILCYFVQNNNIKYLMIQRKDSLCYIEFLRGKYSSVNDIQFKSGASTLGGTTDFNINTSSSPATVHLQGPMYSSSGTSGFHAININGNATVGGSMTIGGAVPATQDDVIALAIALG